MIYSDSFFTCLYCYCAFIHFVDSSHTWLGRVKTAGHPLRLLSGAQMWAMEGQHSPSSPAQSAKATSVNFSQDGLMYCLNTQSSAAIDKRILPSNSWECNPPANRAREADGQTAETGATCCPLATIIANSRGRSRLHSRQPHVYVVDRLHQVALDAADGGVATLGVLNNDC